MISIPDINVDFVRSLPRISLADKATLPDRKGVYFVCVESPVFQVLYIGQSSVSLRERWRFHDKIKDFAVIHLSYPVWIHYLLLDWNSVDIEIMEYAAIKKIPCVMNTHYNDIKDMMIPVLPENHIRAIAQDVDRPLHEYSSDDLRAILEKLGVYLFDSNRSKTWMVKTICNILFPEEKDKQYHSLVGEEKSRTSVDEVTEDYPLLSEDILDKLIEIDDLDVADVVRIDPENSNSYADITIRQMKRIASAFKVVGYSEMTKTELAHNINIAVQGLSKIARSANTILRS